MNPTFRLVGIPPQTALEDIASNFALTAIFIFLPGTVMAFISNL
jgi:hypothetical protein